MFYLLAAVLWFAVLLITFLVINGVSYWLDTRKRRQQSYRRWRGAALLLLPLLLLAGCANTDTNAVLNAVDDAAAIAETSVVLFTDPGPQQTKLLAEIELARKVSDLPALRRIISQFNGNPATRPVSSIK